MMPNEPRYHVMSLSPTEQAVMRTILSEHFCRQAEAIIAGTTGRSPVKLDTSMSRFSNAFDHFDACTAGLPTVYGVNSAKVKVLYLSAESMRYVTDAVEQFDLKKFSGIKALQELVEAVYPRLKARVNASGRFDYTMSEIAAEQKR